MFFGRLLPIVRTFISFPAGVTRMPIVPFIVYSTAGAFPWSIAARLRGHACSAPTGSTIRHALQPFDLAIAVAVVAGVVVFIWWRLGMPGPAGSRQAPSPRPVDGLRRLRGLARVAGPRGTSR